jgi:hypothetical protein
VGIVCRDGAPAGWRYERSKRNADRKACDNDSFECVICELKNYQDQDDADSDRVGHHNVTESGVAFEENARDISRPCPLRARALRLGNSDDDALGRGTHGASKGAQIEAGPVLLKNREDHRSIAVRAKRALIGSFAVEKRGAGTTEHKRFPWLGGSATLSVTDRCLDGAVMEASCASGSQASGQCCSLSKINAINPVPNLSAVPRFSDNSTERLKSRFLRNHLQMAALSHHGHPIRHLPSWR